MFTTNVLISRKWYQTVDKLQRTINRKSYPDNRLVPVNNDLEGYYSYVNSLATDNIIVISAYISY